MSAVRYSAFVSFVVYTRNASSSVADLIPRVDSLLKEHFARHEIIVVDDASTDDTSAVLAGLAGTLEGTLVHLRLARRQGGETAMLAGLARTMGDFVFESGHPDPDWNLPLLVALYERAATGVDIVSATTGQVSASRRRLFKIMNRFSAVQVMPAPEPVRIVSRRALNAMLDLGEHVRFRRALYAVTGYPQAVIQYPRTRRPITLRDRARSEGARRGVDVILSFSDVGLGAVHVLALVFAVFSALATVYTVAVFLFADTVVSGWTTTMLFLSFGFTGLFLVLAILGEYMARLLAEVRERPPYVLSGSTVYSAHRSSDQLPVTLVTDDPVDGAAPLSQAVDGAAGGVQVTSARSHEPTDQIEGT